MKLSSVPNTPDDSDYGSTQHISVVVPVYSGEDYLRSLWSELVELRQRLDDSAGPLALNEIVFVNDEARDGSAEILAEIEEADPSVTVVSMSRNFGQHGATIAGMLHTTGEWVVSLDEDLQHPPHLIPELISVAVQDELDVVYAYPSTRAHSAFRDWASRTAKRSIAVMSGMKQLNLASSFRVMRGPIARAAGSTASHQTYLDTALAWFTSRATRALIDTTDPRAEQGDDSGYSLGRLFGHARRALTAGDMRILRLVGGIGLIGVAAAAVLGIRLLILWLTGNLDRDAIGWPSTFAALLFFGGVIATQVVVLTEYAISSALHLRGKPAYFAVDRSKDAELRRYFKDHPASDQDTTELQQQPPRAA